MTDPKSRWTLTSRQVRMLGFGSMIAIIALMAMVSFYQAMTVQTSLSDIRDNLRSRSSVVEDLTLDFNELRAKFTIFVVEEQSDIKPMLVHANTILEKAEKFNKDHTDIATAEHMEKFIEALKKYRTAMVAYANELAIGRAGASARAWERTLLELEAQANSSLSEIKIVTRNLISQKEDELQSTVKSLRTWGLVIGAIGIIAGFFVAFQLQRALRQPVERLIHVAEKVAAGDLTQRPEGMKDDEIGILANAISTMVENLQRIVGGIRVAFESLDTAARNLETAASAVSKETGFQNDEIRTVSDSVGAMSDKFRELTQDVKQVTGALDQSSVSVQEMSASIRNVHGMADTMAREVDAISSSLMEMNRNTGQTVEYLGSLSRSSQKMAETIRDMTKAMQSMGTSAQESLSLAESVTRLASEQGIPSVDNVVDVTRKNRDLVEHYSRLIYSLGERSLNIGEILDVIREVAQQTNLLSLNAAIIANQAGEHGKAFTVVAEEIGKLSATTATNVKKIASVIKTVREEVSEAVSFIDQVKDQAETSITSSEKAKDILKEITVVSQRSTQMATQMARTAASQAVQSSQALEIVEINVRQVNDINRAVEEQKRGSDLIVASSDELNSISDQLKRSTEEQTAASSTVSNTIADTYMFSKDIMSVMEEEDRKAQDIVKSLQIVSEVASTTLASMDSLMHTVNELRELSIKLGPEVSRFKVRA